MRLLAALAALAALGCEPDVKPPPAPVPHVTAEFDPLASPPQLPTPNDLAFTGGDGTHLNVPDQPGDSPAQRAFNHYLNTLTGFPPSSTAQANFTGPIDPASVMVQTSTRPGSIVIVDTTSATLVENATAAVGPDGTSLVIVNPQRWQSGHRFAVMLFGDEDPVGLRAADGGFVLASTTFFFLRAPIPLLERCADPTNPACVCPPEAIADPNDQSCHSAARGLSDAQARQIEPQRAQLDQALRQLIPLAAPNHARGNLVLFWTFTITAQPMTVFDPTTGAVPFPNDVLIDPSTGRVALPIAPGDPQAPLKMELDTLDGFSVSAPETVPVDLPAGDTIDAKTLVPARTVLLDNLDPTPGAEQPTFGAGFSFGQIAIQPLTALVPDQRKYAAVLTRAITDQAGQPLAPGPAVALVVQENPLFDGTHSTVSVLDDAQAQQLEALRQALQPLLALLGARGISRDQIAAVFTFTTQSIARPLAALDAFPAQADLPVDVTATIYTDFSGLPPELQPFVADVKAVVLGTFPSQLVYDPATRVVTFTRMPSAAQPTVPQADVFTVTPAAVLPATIHYWLTIPKAAPGPGGAPIVVAQHGITSWRGDLFSLGEDFAKGGAATIAFDLDFHGTRTRCSSDDQCLGSCNTTTGVCQGGFKPQPTTDNPFACVLAAFSGDTGTDCKPAASGNGVLDPTNLFGGRITGYQYVVDAAQLERVLTATGDNTLQQQLIAASITPAIDPTRIRFIGQSLGGIEAAVFLATDPRPGDGNVLNVTGGHLFEVLADGAFKGVIDQFLMAQNIMRGTAQYAQLVATARWVLDPVDPWSVARMINRAPSFSYITGTPNAPKLAIVQEAGMDTVIPPQYQAAVSSQLYFPNGVDQAGHAQGKRADGTFVSTFFPDANHGTLVSAEPSPAMRVQAVTYVLSAGTQLPAPNP